MILNTNEHSKQKFDKLPCKVQVFFFCSPKFLAFSENLNFYCVFPQSSYTISICAHPDWYIYNIFFSLFFHFISFICHCKSQTAAVENSQKAYQEAFDIAKSKMPTTHPIRLGLALNFSVFYYEILNSPDRACHLAKQVEKVLKKHLWKKQGGSIWVLKEKRFKKIAWIWSHHLHLQWKFAWRNFKNIFSRPLFTIIFRPDILKFSPIFHFDQINLHNGFVIYCVLK